MRLRGLVLEQRPRVRRRLGHAGLDDARAQPFELSDPPLGGVAALGRTAVADPGRLPKQADRQPGERGSRNRPAVRTDHISATSATSAPSARRCRASGRAGTRRPSGSAPTATSARRSRSTPTAAGSSNPCRCRARGRRGRPPARQRFRSTSLRSSCRVRRVVAGAVPLARAEDAPGELGQVRLADDHRARVDQPLDGDALRVGHVLAVDLRAVGRPDPRRCRRGP